MSQYVKVPAPLIQGIVNYLATRPYNEVSEAMAALNTLKIESGDATDTTPAETASAE